MCLVFHISDSYFVTMHYSLTVIFSYWEIKLSGLSFAEDTYTNESTEAWTF